MKKLAKAGIVTEEVARIAGRVRDDIDTKRDYDFGYFGLKTLEKELSSTTRWCLDGNPTVHVHAGRNRYPRGRY